QPNEVFPVRSCAVGPLRRWAFAPLGSCAVGPLRRWAFASLGLCAVGLLRRWAPARLGFCAVGPLRPWPDRPPFVAFAISLPGERLTTAECGPKLPPSYNAGVVRWAY